LRFNFPFFEGFGVKCLGSGKRKGWFFDNYIQVER
jgi:hypothetical protein